MSANADTIVFPFLGAELGGSHISAFTLGQELVRRFNKRCVVIAPEGSRIGREASDRGFEILVSGERPIMRNSPLFDVTRLLPRIGVLRRAGPGALVHCNDIGALQSWGVAAKCLRLPVIYHHRALNRMILPNRIVLKLADAVICISAQVRRSLAAARLARVSTVLNPFAVSLAFDRTAARADLVGRHSFEEDAFIVGFIGNFWARKRPFFFLDACRRILQKNPKARFVLFGRNGEIGESQLLEHARKLGIAGRTTFAGFQLPIEKNIAALDLLLAPAIAEPFGRTLIEAVLLGTPYVATDDAGHSEIALQWNGGFLVEPAASEVQFADAALAVAGRASAVVLPPPLRRSVAEEFSAEMHARKVMKIYDEVADDRRLILNRSSRPWRWKTSD